MHERTERALCRLAFVLFCALPTLGTVAVTVLVRTPWYHQREISALELVLTQRLGVVVEIGDMQRPAPGAWQIDDLVLKDPETRAELARVRRASYAMLRERAYMHLSEPAIQSQRLDLLWRIVHDRFLCQPDLVGQGLDLVANDLSIHSRLRGMTVSPVRVWIEPREHATTAIARFSLADAGEGEPAVLSVMRSRADSRLRTRWELVTGSSPLPCSVLADYLPAMERLGRDADFSGILRWELEGEDYTVELQGATFRNVNLAMLTEPFDHRISGLGTIEILGLTRHSGQPISQASGRLIARDCRVDQPLLRSLVQRFRAAAPPLGEDPAARIDCQLMAVHFELYGSDVRLAGICPEQPGFESMHPGTAIVAGHRPLVQLDPNRPVPSVAITGIPPGGGDQWVRDLIPEQSQKGDAPLFR